MYIGKYVKLRECRNEDVEPALKYLNDFEVRRLLQSGIPYPYTLSDEQKFISSQSAMKDKYTFAIENLSDGRYIGGCGVNEVDWKNSWAVIGIFIGDKSCWDKGYGTDAMKLLIRFVFDYMNINKIKLNVYSYNKRAIRCYEKCGFKVDGVLREEIYMDGQYYDEIIMSLLRSEYRLLTCND